ncbi:MAG: hydroxymethylglutaryl-CoA synthase [Maribacter sp.]|jgi:hydroxymethylglutaryl-CoA synthase
MNSYSSVGIDDMSLYVPQLYFDIKDLAEARGIEYLKLNKGLGLSQMAIPDAHEDSATMAANAILELILKNDLCPQQIGRIYMGTESALDGAKPTATYALEMLRNYFSKEHGEDCFLHCDVIDMTFACIGGVDALNNTIDWVSGYEDRIGIVVSSDNAKYELASTGEYTQGAGAVAMLVKSNPRLISFDDNWGVATMGVHDFFKPLRHISKRDLIAEVLNWADLTETDSSSIEQKTNHSLETKGMIDANEAILTIHKSTPIFDGQFSNQCYQSRMTEAFAHFSGKVVAKGIYQASDAITQSWERLIFHLPYAFHGRRIFSPIFIDESKKSGTWTALLAKNEIVFPERADFEDDRTFGKAQNAVLRSISKTPEYKAFIQEKIAPSEWASGLVGNMYAGSIFLALVSTLEVAANNDDDLSGKKFGFIAYGSGSKSKVFEGILQDGWKNVAASLNIGKKLDARTRIDYNTYQNLHTGYAKDSFIVANKSFKLVRIGTEGTDEGARYYEWAE